MVDLQINEKILFTINNNNEITKMKKELFKLRCHANVGQIYNFIFT